MIFIDKCAEQLDLAETMFFVQATASARQEIGTRVSTKPMSTIQILTECVFFRNDYRLAQSFHTVDAASTVVERA